MMTEFFMAMTPPTVTAQEHKVAVQNGKPIFYDPPEVKEAKSKLLAYLSRYVPKAPYERGISLVVKWMFPTTDSRKNGKYRTTKPDTDNLQKML